mgnify:CR=1 FL=1
MQNDPYREKQGPMGRSIPGELETQGLESAATSVAGVPRSGARAVVGRGIAGRSRVDAVAHTVISTILSPAPYLLRMSGVACGAIVCGRVALGSAGSVIAHAVALVSAGSLGPLAAYFTSGALSLLIASAVTPTPHIALTFSNGAVTSA